MIINIEYIDIKLWQDTLLDNSWEKLFNIKILLTLHNVTKSEKVAFDVLWIVVRKLPFNVLHNSLGIYYQ